MLEQLFSIVTPVYLCIAVGFVWRRIGRPIDNIQIYLLDERREPVPIGVPGELYVGGEEHLDVALGSLTKEQHMRC